MCGRYSVIPKKDSKSHLGKILAETVEQAHYNAAPSQSLPVVTNEKPNTVQFFSWGLLPFWAKDTKAVKRPINARAETITEKPSFRNLLKLKRCLVPADGFFEWKVTDHGKVPHRITMKDGDLFSFAGLWDEWLDKSTGEIINTFSIITASANELVNPIHDRMPVILSPEAEELWLDGNESQQGFISLLQPFDADKMMAYPVSTLVNSATNNVPEVINSL
ncbi:SOS response-associated peptidase [Rufibacter hautae]|uniref:Abasic site processing protein n=2 Tax=Rufibacter hautae TaxID=2595005 RepID=A0A5B6TCK6_9BACT|nr:SOS response-associated peptidase [Rufibacter hautae]